jgi:hypothetical protein
MSGSIGRSFNWDTDPPASPEPLAMAGRFSQIFTD